MIAHGELEGKGLFRPAVPYSTCGARLVLGWLLTLIPLGCASSSLKRSGTTASASPSRRLVRDASPLTPVTSPVQALAVASYRLREEMPERDGCSPKAALDRLPPDGVSSSAGSTTAPGWPRPEKRLPTAGRPLRVEGPDRLRVSRPELRGHVSRGGDFQIHVVLGSKAEGRARDGPEGAGQSRGAPTRAIIPTWVEVANSVARGGDGIARRGSCGAAPGRTRSPS